MIAAFSIAIAAIVAAAVAAWVITDITFDVPEA